MLPTSEKNIPSPCPYKVLKYDSKIDDLSKLNSIAQSAYQKNINFFDQKNNQQININFVYSDNELAAAMPIPFQSWHKAFADKNDIYLFSPNLPKGEDSETHLSHEMAHIFTNQLFGASNPNWLREGIADLVAKPSYLYNGVFSINSNIDFNDLHYSKDWQNNPKYKRAGLFTEYLINNFGKNTLFKLMTQIIPKISTNNTPEQFADLFTTVYQKNFYKITQKFYSQYPKFSPSLSKK